MKRNKSAAAPLTSDRKMSFDMRILRRASADDEPYWLTVRCVDQERKKTVAALLTEINDDPDRKDAGGQPFATIAWENSCLQKKCGACAMIINKIPALACGTFLEDAVKKSTLTLEPLRKFPVIADLMVDRSVIYEDLKTMNTWMEGDAAIANMKTRQTAYDASRCLQCGLCLEVCPNFAPGGEFYGASSFVPASRLISSMSPKEQDALRKTYREHIYAGCAKSLACMDICPAHIDMDRMLSSSAAAAVWGRAGKADH